MAFVNRFGLFGAAVTAAAIVVVIVIEAQCNPAVWFVAWTSARIRKKKKKMPSRLCCYFVWIELCVFFDMHRFYAEGKQINRVYWFNITFLFTWWQYRCMHFLFVVRPHMRGWRLVNVAGVTNLNSLGMPYKRRCFSLAPHEPVFSSIWGIRTRGSKVRWTILLKRIYQGGN